ncbi:MAG: substrate-binding domain-containing protein [Nitrospirae bacterium]|nr:substrate-binding domain-containing protein [Nitrospirota bacterium]
MKKRFSLLLAVMIAMAFAASQVFAAELVLPGSTTIQKRVLEPSADAIEKATGIRINVLGIGSGGGFKQLMEGKVKASLASNPLSILLKKNNLPDDGTYVQHTIIEDVIVPIVHPSNQVSALTWQQLSDINIGKITNWKEVGGPDMKIIVVTSHEGSATRDVFQEEVMKKAGYIKEARTVQSTREEVNLVAKFKGGVGAVSKGFVDLNPGKVKVIKTDAISRPLSFITKGKPDSDVQAIIDYLMTPGARKYFN